MKLVDFLIVVVLLPVVLWVYFNLPDDDPVEEHRGGNPQRWRLQ